MEDFPPARRRRRIGAVSAAVAALSLTVPPLAAPVFTSPVSAAPATGTPAPAPGAPASGGPVPVGPVPDRPDRRPPGWCKPGGALAARTMPRKIKLTQCDLRGRMVRGANGLAAYVPMDGTSVTAHALRTDGAAELRVQVDPQAREITITTHGARVPQGRPREVRAPLDPCGDGTYQPEPSTWPKGTTVEWSYSQGPGGQSEEGVTKGVANTFDASTDCTPEHRFRPLPAVAQRRTGAAERPPNVTAGAACGRRNQMNTFGWLPMPRAEDEVLAATCTWYSGTRTVETDMALQAQDKNWWNGGTCPPGSYNTEAVVTHESGHVLGLSHVEGPEHSKLTMAPSLAACDDGPATLGKGEYDGLIALYGAR